MTDNEADTITQLMRQIEVLRDALQGRTVSCGQCNAMAKERDELKAQLQNVQFLHERMMTRGVRPVVGERMNELQKCVKQTQKQASDLTSQLHHARKDLGQLRDAVRQYLQLDEGMHGRQWLNARERLKQLTHVKP